MNSGKVILGALAGLAAGALIGVLFAPDKGSDLRGKIIKKSDDYLDSVKKKFNTLLDSISGKYDGGRVEVSDIKEPGRSSKKEMQTS
jgi:gas vesicle protein